MNTTNLTPAAATTARPGRRGELLATFGLLSVALFLFAPAANNLVLTRIWERQTRSQVAETAPDILNLLARQVRESLNEPPERLQRLADNCLRIPNVWSCRITPLAPGAPASPVFAARRDADGAAWVQHKTEICGPDGARRALLEVGFGADPPAAMTTALWTTGGAIAAVALALFGAFYHRARCRLRPITDIHRNLLAYHAGLENELELLTMPSAAAGSRAANGHGGPAPSDGETVRAWNALIGFVRDLQRELDEHRCRQALAQSMPLLHAQSAQAILNALPIGVLRLDGRQRVLYANAAATRLLGMRSEPAAPAERSLVEQVADAKLVEAVLALRQNAGRMGVDFRLEHGTGHTILRLTRIIAGAEHEEELVVMAQDISQLKEAERARDEFLAHITHELRTPLTNIRAYTETLNEDFFDDEQTRRECYNVIMSETRRLSSLIEDVLSVSQMEAGGPRLERVRTRIDQSLRQVTQEMQAAADAKEIKLTLALPSKLPAVRGDPFRLHQVWTNLIGNAVKYTPRGGQVGVDAQGDERTLRVRVTDTGIGIAPENHQKIFEKFFRVKDAAVEAQPGTGLGLPIAREIVRLHGGEITVESELGRGATLIVELPAARETDTDELLEAGHGAHRHR